MIQKIKTPVSVVTVYDHKKRQVFPRALLWEGKIYQLIKIGLHHTYRQGRKLLHVFSVANQEMFFRLVLDTETLHWTLEEVGDKEA
jgi:hypothetical protein